MYEGLTLINHTRVIGAVTTPRRYSEEVSLVSVRDNPAQPFVRNMTTTMEHYLDRYSSREIMQTLLYAVADLGNYCKNDVCPPLRHRAPAAERRRPLTCRVRIVAAPPGRMVTPP